MVRLWRPTIFELECATVSKIATPNSERRVRRRLIQPSHDFLCPCSPRRSLAERTLRDRGCGMTIPSFSCVGTPNRSTGRSIRMGIRDQARRLHETSASSLPSMLGHVSSRGCRREDSTRRSLRCRLCVPGVRCALEGDCDPTERGHDRMAVESGGITALGDRVFRMRCACTANPLAFRAPRRCTR